mmetsp:Transcript_26398/g.52951  ORF Transcript_26398/g.52951 Transcript_26398/m.52951 type:complete len:211 (+) Transcript_26398:590-1222(+)
MVAQKGRPLHEQRNIPGYCGGDRLQHRHQRPHGHVRRVRRDFSQLQALRHARHDPRIHEPVDHRGGQLPPVRASLAVRARQGHVLCPPRRQVQARLLLHRHPAAIHHTPAVREAADPLQRAVGAGEHHGGAQVEPGGAHDRGRGDHGTLQQKRRHLQPHSQPRRRTLRRRNKVPAVGDRQGPQGEEPVAQRGSDTGGGERDSGERADHPR